jgi:hypothetical protein
MRQRPVCFRQQLHVLPDRSLPILQLSYFHELHGVRFRPISIQHWRHQLQLVLRVPEWQDIFGGHLKLYHSHMRQRPVCFRQQLHILPDRSLPIL